MSANLNTLQKRDTKDLYLQAVCGEIDAVIGVSDGVAYEPPSNPELLIDTDSESVHGQLKTSSNLQLTFVTKNKSLGFAFLSLAN